MICKKCKTKLVIRQVYSHDEFKIQRAKCNTCGMFFTLYSAMLAEDPDVGEGAEAWYSRLKNGEKSIRLSVENPGSIF